MSTLGTVDNLKHFLPRILEMAAKEGSVRCVDFEIVLGKLSYSGWTDWPEGERIAVGQYLMAVWVIILGNKSTALDAGRGLCGIAQCAEILSPFLNAWQSDTAFASLWHLAEFLHDNWDCLRKHRKLRNAFWKDHEPQQLQILEWLLSPETSEYYLDLFFKNSSADVSGELSTIVEYLGWLQAALG